MIVVVDYGLGNVAAFLNMYKRMNIPARAATTSDELADASRIILPGVGAFDHAMDRFDQSGMRDTLERKVMSGDAAVLGVCVGMQILTDRSDEGTRPGLGWIPGEVRSFAGRQSRDLPSPHMGWNDVRPTSADPMFGDGEEEKRFYFLHSYFVEPQDPAHIAATCEYGIEFPCAIHRENVWGVQFHPEKSHRFGAALLRNFALI